MATETNKNFSCGKRLRQLRQIYSLSQEELALAANITPAYLGLVEREERNPTVKTIEKLCNAIGISLRDFFDETGETNNISEEDIIIESIAALIRGKDNETRQIILQIMKLMMKL